MFKIFDNASKYGEVSYSQEGEDLILNGFLGDVAKGFYVDIGAYHPFKFSNTYFFYKKGWRGINVDATPGSMRLFNRFRPRDINVESPVSNVLKNMKYFLFDEPALNSFSADLSNERVEHTKYRIEKTVNLTPAKLSEILDKYLPKKTKIDFLSIDVEGVEYQVLLSNNWNKYKPEFILIEILNVNLDKLNENRTYRFLQNKRYSLIGATGRTLIFKKI